MLDEVGVRELLAGLELEKGDIEADRDRQMMRASQSERRLVEVSAEAAALRARGVWIGIGSSAGTAAAVLTIMLVTLKVLGKLDTATVAP